jgi:hypothetical protein
VSGLFFVFIKKSQIFLRSIEVEPAQGFAVIVVEQYAEVALGIPGHNTVDFEYLSQDRPNNVVAFQLFNSRDYLVVFRVLLAL